MPVIARSSWNAKLLPAMQQKTHFLSLDETKKKGLMHIDLKLCAKIRTIPHIITYRQIQILIP